MEQLKYTFSRTINEVNFVNNFEIYSLILIVFTSILSFLFYNSVSSIGIFIALLFVILFLFLFASHFKNAAYKIVIDIFNNEINFFMFRSAGHHTYSLSEIDKIENSGYLIFFLKNSKKIIL